MIVVSDASVLLALANCRSLPLLDSLFEELHVPGAVYDELAVPDKPMAESVCRFLEEKVTRVKAGELAAEPQGLGSREREAMALYRQLGADLLLVDDKRARKAAQANGIRISGSLGVLLLAKERGLLKRVRPLLEELQASEIYVDERLIRKTMQLASRGRIELAPEGQSPAPNSKGQSLKVSANSFLNAISKLQESPSAGLSNPSEAVSVAKRPASPPAAAGKLEAQGRIQKVLWGCLFGFGSFLFGPQTFLAGI